MRSFPPTASRVCLCLLLVASTRPARADSPEAQEQVAAAAYLPIQCIQLREDGLIVQAGVQITDGANRWFDVTFALAGDEDLPPDPGNMQRWGSLFVPSSPSSVRWDDLRFGFTREAIASVAASTTDLQGVCVICRVYPAGAKKPLEGYWQSRLRLLVQLNQLGGLQSVQPVQAAPFAPLRGQGRIPIRARKASLKDSDLQLGQGVELCKAIDPSGQVYNLLVRGTQLCALGSVTTGMFLEKIDSPAKARQLVELSLQGGWKILSADQYEQIASRASDLGAHVAQAPKSFKPHVSRIPSIGYRVRMALLHRGSEDDSPLQVSRIDRIVLENGQVCDQSSPLIQPGPKCDLQAYGRMMSIQKNALIGQEIPDPLEVSSQSLTIPCPPHTRKGDWLDPAHWSAGAGG